VRITGWKGLNKLLGAAEELWANGKYEFLLLATMMCV